MPVYWLEEKTITFPHPDLANKDGVLAVGGDLSPQRLILAYQNGIFPWYNPEDPIIWWSPDPRFVLFPKELKVAKSMRTYFNQKKFDLTVDQDFEAVMRNCQQQKRNGQGGGTWISEQMIYAYCRLHDLGFAHSVEVWEDQNLVGGFYGIGLGKCFFGESMFTKVSNASKFGFIAFVKKLETLGFDLIDCQQQTKHLERFGARNISRKEFLKYLEINQHKETWKGNWKDLFEKE